jgi:hypothetical protein
VNDADILWVAEANDRKCENHHEATHPGTSNNTAASAFQSSACPCRRCMSGKQLPQVSCRSRNNIPTLRSKRSRCEPCVHTWRPWLLSNIWTTLSARSAVKHNALRTSSSKTCWEKAKVSGCKTVVGYNYTHTLSPRQPAKSPQWSLWGSTSKSERFRHAREATSQPYLSLGLRGSTADGAQSVGSIQCCLCAADMSL